MAKRTRFAKFVAACVALPAATTISYKMDVITDRSIILKRIIPSLDGIRAVSVGFVLLFHFLLGSGLNVWISLEQQGFLGVRIFFVVSGFLITGLLTHELASAGTIDLRKFYVRRTLRIFPAYYVFLIVTVTLLTFGILQSGAGYRLQRSAYAFAYLTDFFDVGTWQLGHTWSLSVEEQFYFVWPILFLSLGSRRGRAGLLLFVFATPLLRCLIFAACFVSGGHYPTWTSFTISFESIATGCLLALSRESLHSLSAYRTFLRSRWFVVIPLSVAIVSLAGAPNVGSRYAANCVGLFTFLNFGIALLIDRAITLPPSWLNIAPMRYVGRLSYSIYLWQQLFLGVHNDLSAFALVALVSVASYHLVELPALSLRRAIAPNPQSIADPVTR